MNALVSKAYMEDESGAPVDYCVIPVTPLLKRKLRQLQAVLAFAQAQGVEVPEVSGVIDALWLDDGENEIVDSVGGPLDQAGWAVIEERIEWGPTEDSRATVSGDGTFWVTRIDDFKPRTCYFLYEKKKDLAA